MNGRPALWTACGSGGMFPAVIMGSVSSGQARRTLESGLAGSSCVRMWKKPGGFFLSPVFVGGDLILIGESQPDVVKSFQKTFLAERIDIEGPSGSIRKDYGLGREVDRDPVAVLAGDFPEQPVNLVFRESYGKNAVFEAVVVEDVGETRSQDGTDAKIQKGPGGMFPGASGPKVLPCDKNVGIFVAFLVQDEIRVRGFFRLPGTASRRTG